MTKLHAMARALALILAVFCAGSAQAVTICIAPCDGSGGATPVDVFDLTGLATLGIDGFVLEADDQGLTINVDGDLVLHVPSGTLVSTVIDIRALGAIHVQEVGFNTGDGPTSLCANPSCLAFESEIQNFSSDPFHLAVLGPLNGPLEIFAAGNILITTTSIPEPGTGVLIALGLFGLSRQRRGVASS